MHYKQSLKALVAALALAGSIGSSLADSLKVGYLPVTGHGKFFVAKEQGFFAKEEGRPGIVRNPRKNRLVDCSEKENQPS